VAPELIGASAFTEDELAALAAVPQMPGHGGTTDARGGGGGTGDDGGPEMGKPVKVTADQRAIFDQAAAAVRTQEGADLSDGRILELICGDFLAGIQGEAE